MGEGAPAPPSHPSVGCLIRHAVNHLYFASPSLATTGPAWPPVKWGERFCWVGRLRSLSPDSRPLLLFESGTLARACCSLSRSASSLRFITSLATALHLFLHPNICRTRLGSERSCPTFSIRTPSLTLPAFPGAFLEGVMAPLIAPRTSQYSQLEFLILAGTPDRRACWYQ